MLFHTLELRKMQNFKLGECIERFCIPQLTSEFRLQDYGYQVLNTIATKSAFKKSIKKGLVFLDGRLAKTSDWVKAGQVLEVYAETLKHPHKIFKLHLDVLFEDDYLAVIHKPSGYPTNGNYFKTIEHALPFNLTDSTQTNKLPWPQPVHRLDNPTSGLLVVAKTNTAKSLLSTLIENQGITKSYIAIVEGLLKPNQGMITAPIQAKASTTAYEVSKVFKQNQHRFSLVNLHPKSGRTHQLRIHLSGKSHPIIGDSEYGTHFTNEPLYLHASSLHFKHPITHKTLNFSTEIPHKFVKFMNRTQ